MDTSGQALFLQYALCSVAILTSASQSDHGCSSSTTPHCGLRSKRNVPDLLHRRPDEIQALPSGNCNNPLLQFASISASSSLDSPSRRAESARFSVGGAKNAWSPVVSDFNQFLLVDLMEIMHVSRIATQGRAKTQEFVQNYTLEYGQEPGHLIPLTDRFNAPQFPRMMMVTAVSTGSAAEACPSEKVELSEPKPRSAFVQAYRILHSADADGEFVEAVADRHSMRKVFPGNNDSTTVHRNSLPYPIVARYVRINPRQWSQAIALRLELYGCTYESDVASFDGSSYLSINLATSPITASEDSLHFRFKTIEREGVLVYSQGTQGDIIVLQLVGSRLLLTLGLGGGIVNKVQCGSALDDGLWHTVRILRDERKVDFIVDRITESFILEGGFYKLNLEKKIFIGGVDLRSRYGIQSRSNFKGCLENFRFNNTNVIWQMKNVHPVGFERVRSVVYDHCPEMAVHPLTFTTIEAYLRLPAQSAATMNCSFQFRTFESKGVLLFRELADSGYVKVYLDRHILKLRIFVKGIPEDTIDAFPDVRVADGLWHSYDLSMRTNSIIQTLDGRVSSTKRKLDFKTRPSYLFGSRGEEDPGFRGCLRLLAIDGAGVDFAAVLTRLSATDFNHLLSDECSMRDRCSPNPCQHGGVCRQNWEEFSCDCSRTGYAGAVCLVSLHPITCEEYREYNPRSREASIRLDLDGSGPLDPFPVLCRFFDDGRTETHLSHDSMEETAVDGFQNPLSYVQNIHYNASWIQLAALVNSSHLCRQFLKYSCRNARLLNTPVGPPFAHWISRSNLKMLNWGGVSPGLPSCSCGLSESCHQRDRSCNCDSDENLLRNQFLVDEGWLTHKDYLPVRQLAFGDTGSLSDSKESRYHLGPLICEGSATRAILSEAVSTFHYTCMNYNHQACRVSPTSGPRATVSGRLFVNTTGFWGTALLDNAVTFWRQDATLIIPQVDWGEGDIFFQFRTTVESGLFLHVNADMDEAKVALVSPTEVQFSWSAGRGPKSLSLHFTRPVNDNQWHSVSVERNRKEARIRLDGSFSAHLASVEEGYRELQLREDLMIGASVDLSGGYVGCFRSLMINGLLYDLRSVAVLGAYGVLPGCVGKCASGPCMNLGVCQERYDSFKCDCRFTAFRGPLCSDEIGAHFRADDQVEYHFTTSSLSTTGEHMRVGFMTTEPRGILMQVMGRNDEYISLEISNAATVRVAFDLGFERQEIYEQSQNYADGQYHDVHVWRTNEGRTVNVQVDDYDVISQTYRIGNKQDAQLNDVRVIYIGRNNSMREREGFIGCLSRVSFEDFFILKQLFQQNPPDNVKANRRMREDWCDIQPATHAPEIIALRPDGRLGGGPAAYPVGLETDQSSIPDQTVLGVVMAVVVALLLACVILLVRCLLRKNSKDKHVTEVDGANENEGADEVMVPLRSTGDGEAAVVEEQGGHVETLEVVEISPRLASAKLPNPAGRSRRKKEYFL